jgi:hypothetical protein
MKTNYRLWRAQIMPAVRASQLENLLTGIGHMLAKTVTVKHGDSTTEKGNVEYTKWVTHDHALLGYTLSSLTREVLMSVMTHTTTARAWGTLEEMFASCARS